MSSEGRAGDVARTDELLQRAVRDGVVRLPELSAAELYMLCDDSHVLVEEPEYAWWYGMKPARRARLTEAAASLLAFRELLRPPAAERETGDPDGRQADGRVPLAMAPEVSVIITARKNPVVVAVGTIGGNPAGGAPRMYGLGGLDGRPQVLVAEQVTSQVSKRFGAVHKFALLSPARAGEALADWASEAGKAREIDVYRHRDDGLLTRDTATVTSRHGTQTVARHQPGAAPGQPAWCDRASLALLAAAMLNGEAS
jgi:hypothetical protein